MPRFFFDIDDGMNPLLDSFGMVLLDSLAAQIEATRALLEMAESALPGPNELRRDLIIGVRDETGAKLLDVSLTFEIHLPS